MSFEDLAAHASDIVFRATKHAIENSELEPAYAASGVDGYYQQLVPALFSPFYSLPDPAKYQPLIDDLNTAMTRISTGRLGSDPLAPNGKNTYLANPELAEIVSASSFLADWTGEGAKEFRTEFLDKFPFVAENQFILTAAVKAGLEAHQSIWAAARTDIDKIAHATLDAFDNIDDGCCDKNAWTIGFTVLAAIAFIGASLVTAGGAAAITLTIIGASSSVGAVTPPDGLPDHLEGAGETSIQIVSAMKSAIDALTAAIEVQENRLSASLLELAEKVRQVQSKPLFELPRPHLAMLRAGELIGDAGLGESE